MTGKRRACPRNGGQKGWKGVRARGADATVELCLAFATPLRRYVRRFVREKADIEDIAQESLLRLWIAMRAGRLRGSPRAYLFSIAHNLAVDTGCRRGAGVALDGAEPLADSRRNGDCLLRGQIEQAMEHLPQHQRRALWLREFHGLSYAAIAKTMGVTIGDVKVWIHRARKALVKLLDRDGQYIGGRTDEEPKGPESRGGTMFNTFAKASSVILLGSGLLLTGCPDPWLSPRAEIEATGGSDVYTHLNFGVDQDGNLGLIGGAPVEMPVTLREEDFWLYDPGKSFIIVPRWVGHMARRWKPDPPPLGSMTFDGVRLVSVRALYNDLHPSWDEVERGEPYRGDPDRRMEYRASTRTWVTTSHWDNFFEPPLRWMHAYVEDWNAQQTYAAPVEPGVQGISLYVKDAGDIAVDVSDTDQYGDLIYKWVAITTFHHVLQLRQSGQLTYLGVDSAGEYLGGEAYLGTTHAMAGEYEWSVESGPAELRDPSTGNWGSTVNMSVDSGIAPGVRVRATDKSAAIDDIEISVKYAPWGPPAGPAGQAKQVITWKMTTYAPEMVALGYDEPPGSIEHLPMPLGYVSIHHYKVVYHLDNRMVFSNLPVNETCGVRSDVLMNDWPNIIMAGGVTTPRGRFFDALSYSGPYSPQPEPPGCSNNPNVLHYHDQLWRGGTLVPGFGIPLETSKVMYFHICNAWRL